MARSRDRDISEARIEATDYLNAALGELVGRLKRLKIDILCLVGAFDDHQFHRQTPPPGFVCEPLSFPEGVTLVFGRVMF
jgi:hypothetical protein